MRYIVPSSNPGQVVQGCEISGDFILVAEAAEVSGQWNRITAYDFNGKKIRRIKIRGYLELEGMYFVKNKLYVTYYSSDEEVKKKGKYVWKLVRHNYVRKMKSY